MKTTDPNVLKQFVTVLNRQQLTEEIYYALLIRWDLDQIDLDKELDNINQKRSTLSKSRREALPYFIKMRQMLEDKKKEEQKSMNLGADTLKNSAADTLTI